MAATIFTIVVINHFIVNRFAVPLSFIIVIVHCVVELQADVRERHKFSILTAARTPLLVYCPITFLSLRLDSRYPRRG